MVKRINHQLVYSADGACTNGAESFFSRMRRAEQGHHHHIAGTYLARYAQESAWRKDHRRDDNGSQVWGVAGSAGDAERERLRVLAAGGMRNLTTTGRSQQQFIHHHSFFERLWQK